MWVCLLACVLASLVMGFAGTWTPDKESARKIDEFLERWRLECPAAFNLRRHVLALSQHQIKNHTVEAFGLVLLAVLSIIFGVLFAIVWAVNTSATRPDDWRRINTAPMYIILALFAWICSIATFESMRCLSILDYDRWDWKGCIFDCTWETKSIFLRGRMPGLFLQAL
jgi:hypothetical protein